MQACGLPAAHCSLQDLPGSSTVLPQDPRQGALLKQAVLPLLVPSEFGGCSSCFSCVVAFLFDLLLSHSSQKNC
jgi:hypothetical protein